MELTEFLAPFRPSYGQGQHRLIARLKAELEALPQVSHIGVDKVGNLFWATNPESNVLFTAHADDVSPAKRDGELRKLKLNGDILTAHKSTLSADDGVGMYIMLCLTKHGTQGRFAVYTDEEAGRIGSTWSAENEPHRYNGLDHAVSFDRKGSFDTVTTQSGTPCVSDEFDEALRAALGWTDEVCDPCGSYTDSYSLMDLVTNCTNVSVGYAKQHTKNEQQDLSVLAANLEAFKSVDWESLPVGERAEEPEFDDAWGNYYGTWNKAYPAATSYTSENDEELIDTLIYYHSLPQAVAEEMVLSLTPDAVDKCLRALDAKMEAL